MVDRFFILALLGASLVSCSLHSAKKDYVLAERFWTDGNYLSAVKQFEKVYSLDPSGSLGLQALYRGATTQAYFLSQYAEAVGKLKIFAELTQDHNASWDAKKQIGDILFLKMEHYSDAQAHYRAMFAEQPKSSDAPMILFRIARSEFFEWQFQKAIEDYRQLILAYPNSPFAERAYYETGVTYFTRGEQQPQAAGATKGAANKESYQDAIDAFERFLKKYPSSEWVPHAKFGIASCLEEMDQLDAAYHAYESLKKSYPSPNVITIKLVRIRERKAQRSR